MRSILETLQTGKILVSDGAWGTMLQRYGLKAGECPEEWCLTHPDVVENIARQYREAGADLIETNSFGGSRIKLNQFGLGKKAGELNRAAAEISRRIAGQEVFVLGSVGPTGKMLIMGEVTEEEIYQSFKEQVMALEAGGVDAICIETMLDLQEALLAIRAARENTRLEVICNMTFEKGAKGQYNTVMGISPAQFVQAAVEAGATIVGSNCGNGIERMIEITRELRRSNPTVPIMIQSNAGLPRMQGGNLVYPETTEFMSSHIPALIEAGANIVGGCCGTDPSYIKAFAEVVKNLNQNLP
ncbi:MAG: hypothetical protein Kow0042_00790 [Calditrichia bacterium]